MTKNPFLQQGPQVAPELDREASDMPDRCAQSGADDCVGLFNSVWSNAGGARYLATTIGLGAAAFLIVVFFVFRELQHNRELYRMSRMVAAAEAQTRRWQERQRLEEARNASLLAKLYSDQFPMENPQRINISFTFPIKQP